MGRYECRKRVSFLAEQAQQFAFFEGRGKTYTSVDAAEKTELFTSSPISMLYKLRKIEATKWRKNGDHPKDAAFFGKEGAVGRYFRHPAYDGEEKCLKCGHVYNDHGFIDQKEGIKVCPGDYIVTDGAR